MQLIEFETLKHIGTCFPSEKYIRQNKISREYQRYSKK